MYFMVISWLPAFNSPLNDSHGVFMTFTRHLLDAHGSILPLKRVKIPSDVIVHILKAKYKVIDVI